MKRKKWEWKLCVCTCAHGGTNYFSSSLEGNASSSSSRGMGERLEDRGSCPATSISASQHFSFFCVFHSILCLSYLLLSAQLLFIPPLFCTLPRTSRAADQEERERGGSGSVWEPDYGLRTGFKKLPVGRVCWNGFTLAISWIIAGEMWGLVTALVIWHKSMIRPHFMDHYRQWKNWGENVQAVTNSYVSLQHCSGIRLGRMKVVGSICWSWCQIRCFLWVIVRYWLPGTSVLQVINVLLFIQGCSVCELSIL